MYPVLVLALRRESIRRVRRLLLVGWGLFLWLGLVAGALATRGTTAYTAEVSYSTVGTPICNIGNLWIITGLLSRNTMLLGTTLLGFATTTAAWLGLTLTFGRGWCGWYCYLGVPLEIAALLRKRRGRGKLAQAIRWNRPPPWFGYFRYAVLLTAVLLSAWLVTPAFCWICPIRVLFDQWELRFDLLNVITAGTGIALFLGTMVIGPMFTGKRVWCAYFCPLGAATSLLAWLRARVRLPFVGARIDGGRCKRCLACVSACTFNVVSPQDVQRTAGGAVVNLSPDCTACGDCVSACPEGAVELASGTRPLTLPAVRRRAFALALTFFVFLTAFLWAQFIPMFGPR
jgi:ferredoxin